MNVTRTCLVAAALGGLAACASRKPQTIENNPAALAALHADLRLVNGETTWVTRGQGYELLGRTKTDLVAVQSTLDREGAAFRRAFPSDSLTPLVVTTRRLAPVGKPFIADTPVPPLARAIIVEVVLADPTVRQEQAKSRRGPPGDASARMIGDRNPTAPVVRAWLSAHASIVAKHSAAPTQAAGEVDDARVPPWAESLVPSLAADSLVDRFALTLASHAESLIPLTKYFTMPRPEFGPTQAAAAQARGGERGGSGGGMGGMGGGRGGMGGRSGMGGRGGIRGGRGASGGDVSRGAPALQGAALFDAQSLVLARYLEHQSPTLIEALVDAQILGASPDSVIAKESLGTLEQLDVDWRRWLTQRASSLTR